jgi:hypothetical protein
VVRLQVGDSEVGQLGGVVLGALEEVVPGHPGDEEAFREGDVREGELDDGLKLLLLRQVPDLLRQLLTRLGNHQFGLVVRHARGNSTLQHFLYGLQLGVPVLQPLGVDLCLVEDVHGGVDDVKLNRRRGYVGPQLVK